MPFEHGQLDARPAIAAVAVEIAAGGAREIVSARFHNTLIAATASACVRIARERDLATVVLGGGVFQNRLLLEGVAELVTAAGLRVLTPERLPPNDGGISYGQAAIAAASDGAARSGHGRQSRVSRNEPAQARALIRRGPD
jgi:hydrogenase maturation protein HypF